MKSYLDLLRHVMEFGEDRSDRTGVGTRSVFGYEWRHDLSWGFPLLTTKKVPLRWVAEELRWFLSGSTYEPDLAATGVDIWKEWAGEDECGRFGRKAGDLGPIYGALWRNFGHKDHCAEGVDQIARLVNGLTINPFSRRHLVTGWSPADADSVSLPPCHTLWQCYCRNDLRLDLRLYARSIDSFLGLPFNIASYALLTHILANAVGLRPGVLSISFGDLHIYRNHEDAVTEILSREPRGLPSLSIKDRPGLVGLRGVLDWEWSDIDLEGYDPHPKIEADVAV